MLILITFIVASCKMDDPLTEMTSSPTGPGQVGWDKNSNLSLERPTVSHSHGLPHIDRVSPDTAGIGTIVTLHGLFDPNAPINVTINRKSVAVIGNITADSVQIEIPERAGSGYIVVRQNGRADSEAFHYRYKVTVSTLAGNGTAGDKTYRYGSEAQFNRPFQLDIDDGGRLYIADRGNHRIRWVSTDNGFVGEIAGWNQGDKNDYKSKAEFDTPVGVAVNSFYQLEDRRVYVSDANNKKLRSVRGTDYFTDWLTLDLPSGHPTSNKINSPAGMDMDSQGNLYFAQNDINGHKIYKRSSGGSLFLIAGLESGYLDGCENGVFRTKFLFPSDVSHYSDRDRGRNVLYIAEEGNHTIRIMHLNHDCVSLYAGIPASGGFKDTHHTAAQFNAPTGLDVDPDEFVYVADRMNHRIRVISPNGIVSTLAGTGAASFNDGDAITATFNHPSDVIVGPDGNLYVTDESNHAIRKIVFE